MQNYIGYAADGESPLPNGGNGIEITSNATAGVDGVQVGDGSTGDNRFYVRRSNGSDPLRNAIVAIQEPGDEPIRLISIMGNSIDSDGLGIDLRLSTDVVNSVTPNDEDDVDADGPNQFTNFPVITGADGSVPSITGTFNGRPETLHTLAFYKSDSCDSDSRRIGQVYLGFTLIGTDINGDAVFTKTAFTDVFEEGDWITATAIGWNDGRHGTSEFSDCFEATGAAPGLQITQLVPGSMPAGSFDFELKAQGGGFKVGDQIRWNGTPLATDYTDANELRANISPSTIGTTKGLAEIDVVSTNPAATSNQVFFTIARSSSDVNCDGTATAVDALLLEELAGLTANGTGCPSNANQVGGTDVSDVLWIRREVAGLVQPLASFTP